MDHNTWLPIYDADEKENAASQDGASDALSFPPEIVFQIDDSRK